MKHLCDLTAIPSPDTPMELCSITVEGNMKGSAAFESFDKASERRVKLLNRKRARNG